MPDVKKRKRNSPPPKGVDWRKWFHPGLEKFLERFSLHGNFSRAAFEAGIGISTAYRYAKKNPEFRRQFLEAEEIAGIALRDEALRRAVEGVPRAVFYKGEKCGEIRQYSNQMLIFLLRARYPEFRAQQDANSAAFKIASLPNVTVKVIDSAEDAADD